MPALRFAVMPSDTEKLQWEVRLWEHAPGKRIVILAAALVAGVVGTLLLRQPLLGLLGFMVVLGSTTDFWLPVRYTLDEAGAKVRCGFSVAEIEWAKVKRVVQTPEGIKLSPLESPGRMGAFRGVFLRFSGNSGDVLDAVRRHFSGDVRTLEE